MGVTELIQKPIIKIYTWVWKKYLWNEHHQNYDKVLEVKGWRSARIETLGKTRYLKSPCFKFLWMNFK